MAAILDVKRVSKMKPKSISLTKRKAPTNKKQTNKNKTKTKEAKLTTAPQQNLKMRTTFILSFLVLSFLSEYTHAAFLRGKTEDSSLLEQGGRRLDVPQSCPSNAFPGICTNCNGLDGCSAFQCSAFTNWECPAGSDICGVETCVGGLCNGKVWCVTSGRRAVEEAGTSSLELSDTPEIGDENATFLFDTNTALLHAEFLLREQQRPSSDVAVESVGLESVEQGGRRLGVPPQCPSNAFPGICTNCNGLDGCSAFQCSAFTNWECPSGSDMCGIETCVGGLCNSKVWCVWN
jgi:hypothetical protein